MKINNIELPVTIIVKEVRNGIDVVPGPVDGYLVHEYSGTSELDVMVPNNQMELLKSHFKNILLESPKKPYDNKLGCFFTIVVTEYSFISRWQLLAITAPKLKNKKPASLPNRLVVQDDLIDIACKMSQELNDICEVNEGKSVILIQKLLKEWDDKYLQFTKLGGV